MQPEKPSRKTEPSRTARAPGAPRRYLPERPFPPYAFTGEGYGWPHPRTHPEGHGYGVEPAPAAPLDPRRWRECSSYLWGIDLFNRGYYWEAHEAWEDVWVAEGKRGTTAMFLRGLIKLAAAGVKVRQGRPAGVERHAARAAEYFEGALAASGERRFAGLELQDLARLARDIAARRELWPRQENARVAVVFDRALEPT